MPKKGAFREERALGVFGYLKRWRNSCYVVDSRDPIYFGSEEARTRNFTKLLGDACPDAYEEVDCNVPKALIGEMAITIFVDSDHAHDKITCRSITGMMILVGRTLVGYSSKCQGAIETSMYGAEFCAMRQATEEAISVRYMLRCLGVKMETPTAVLGDNEGVILNATIKDSLLKKKHVAISYHKVRESAAAGIIQPMKVNTKDNFADPLRKPLGECNFQRLIGQVSYG